MWKIVGRQKPSAKPRMTRDRMRALTVVEKIGVRKVARDQTATARPRVILPPNLSAALPPIT